MGKVTYVTSAGGDWSGLYINGALAAEDHILDPYSILDVLGVDFVHFEVDQDWLDEAMHLPFNLGDIPPEERHG